MEYYNNMSLSFDKAIDAQKMKKLIADTLNANDFDATYRGTPSTRLVEDLIVTDNSLSLDGSDGYYIPEDMLNVMDAILISIAEANKELSFVCEMATDSTYSECEYDARYERGVLSIDSTYHPNGYMEAFYCYECDALVITAEECERGKTYICPECGEELNFDEDLPVHEHKTIEIH